MDNTLNTSDWQTHCLGRYLIDLPPNAKISTTYEYGSGDLKTISSITEQRFQQRIEERVSELKNTETLGGGEQFVDITRYNDHNVLITSWYSPSGGKVSYKSELFSLRQNGKKSALYLLTAETDPKKLQISKKFRKQLANTIQYRPQSKIPEGPGFCINHGLIASDLPNYETARATITFDHKPGFYLTIMAFPTAHPSEPLFARESGFPEFIVQALSQADTLRHGSRSVDDMQGQEVVRTVTKNGIDYYYGTWQTPGRANSMRFQNVDITIQTETPQTTRSPFPDQESALDFWDAILGNFRMRPGAVGNTP